MRWAFGLIPHLVETWTFSTEPQFVDKVRGSVGLGLNGPDKAIVLCIDEKSQMQTIDREAPIFPIMRAAPTRMIHGYFRHGTTSRFAALDPTSGSVIANHYPAPPPRVPVVPQAGRPCCPTPALPAGYDLHLILNNYATHKTERVKNWKLRHLSGPDVNELGTRRDESGEGGALERRTVVGDELDRSDHTAGRMEPCSGKIGTIYDLAVNFRS
jgi:hypothetical protein